MTVLSKIAHECGFQVMNTNCYETAHTWDPNCWTAILAAVPDGFKYSLKTYAVFYLIATLVAKKDPRKVDWKRYVRDVLQSSVFLTANLLLYLFFICRVRHVVGFFTPLTYGGVSSWLASFFALMFEKQSRRPALALYLTNLASETLYRQAVHHGYMFRMKYGECIPFAGGLMLFMYLYSKGRLNSAMKNFLGITHKLEPSKEIINSKKLPAAFKEFLYDLRTRYPKSEKCDHDHSCVSVAGESFVKNFGVGLGISSALLLVKNVKNIFTRPLKVLSLMASKENLKIPLFFALMPFLFHASRCTMNHHSDLPDSIKNISSIAISSASMMVTPNVSIAMYTLWKGIEAWYYDMAERGKLPYVPHGDHILYSFATGYVLWMAILEPHAIRKGYINFLMGLTGKRLGLIHRPMIDHWGFQSSKIFPLNPVLDTKYCSVNPMLYQSIRPP